MEQPSQVRISSQGYPYLKMNSLKAESYLASEAVCDELLKKQGPSHLAHRMQDRTMLLVTAGWRHAVFLQSLTSNCKRMKRQAASN